MAVELKNITVKYRRNDHAVVAVRDVSFTVASGEFLAIQGPSGAGKSSLLMVVAGLLHPSEGQVSVDGQDLYGQSAEEIAAFRARHVGIIFQRFHLLPYLSVRQNILTPTLAAGLPNAEARTEELIAEFDLQDRSEHLPPQLSVGECQRVATARALLAKPKMLLADEPTGNLDRENAEIVFRAIRAATDVGSSVILVTHDGPSTDRADRVLHLCDGQISPTE